MSVLFTEWNEYEKEIEKILTIDVEEGIEENAFKDLLDEWFEEEYIIVVKHHGKEVSRFTSYPSTK